MRTPHGSRLAAIPQHRKSVRRSLLDTGVYRSPGLPEDGDSYLTPPFPRGPLQDPLKDTFEGKCSEPAPKRAREQMVHFWPPQFAVINAKTRKLKMFLLEVGFSRVAPKHKATQHARVARGLPDKWKPKIETEGL